MQVTLIAKENIPGIWSEMKDWIDEAIEQYGNELSSALLYVELCEGRTQLWIYGINQVSGWALTSISSYHVIKRLRFILMGGFDMQEWLKNIDVIEQWALKFGATEAEAWVRPGLRKKLTAYGYEQKYEVVTKRLEKRVAS